MILLIVLFSALSFGIKISVKTKHNSVQLERQSGMGRVGVGQPKRLEEVVGLAAIVQGLRVFLLVHLHFHLLENTVQFFFDSIFG